MKRTKREAVYRVVNGNRIKVTAREMKRTIMRVEGWTEEQYRKQYDIFKNKLRAYESYVSAHGVTPKMQSAQLLLWKTARAKAKYGAGYVPSLQMKRIQSFSAVSISKGERLAKDFESTYSKRRGETFAETTETAFKRMIKKVPKARELWEGIADPVKREEALKALADHMKIKIDEQGKTEGEAIPEEGEVYGSDEASQDFDTSLWLD